MAPSRARGAVHRVRKASEAGRGVGVLADLQGPKIRLETFPEGPVSSSRGDEFVITTEDVGATARFCGTTYKGLPADVSGRPDPRRRRQRHAARSSRSTARGSHHRHRGRRHLRPQGHQPARRRVYVPALSEKDVEDLRCALRIGGDFIALSFVRGAGRQGRAPRHGRGGPPGPRHRQGREAAGGRQPGGRRRRLRRRHGRPRRPRRGDAAGVGARWCRSARSSCPAQRQAGDRGDADAGVHDQLPARPAPRSPTSPTRSSTAPTR